MAKHEANQPSDHYPDVPPLVPPEVLEAFVSRTNLIPPPDNVEAYMRLVYQRDPKFAIILNGEMNKKSFGNENRKRDLLLGAFSVYSLWQFAADYDAFMYPVIDDDAGEVPPPSTGRHVDRSAEPPFPAPLAPEPDPSDE